MVVVLNLVKSGDEATGVTTDPGPGIVSDSRIDTDLHRINLLERRKQIIETRWPALASAEVLNSRGNSTFPFVSVIVLNLNGEKIIERCLKHLLAQNYPYFEIIVVDNGSTDTSLPRIKAIVASNECIRLYEAGRNLGVPGGRNFGVQHARGELIAFMDSDGYADRSWLPNSVQTFQPDPRIGAVASLVCFERDPLRINGAGGVMNRGGYAWDLGYGESIETVTVLDEALFPMGCGMVVRKDVLEKIGPLDPITVKWYDDVELGIRIWKYGYAVAVQPRAIVDHDLRTADQILSGSNWHRAYLFERARIRTVLKYFSVLNLVRFVARETIANVTLAFSPRWKEVAVRNLAYLWNVLHSPSVFSYRLASNEIAIRDGHDKPFTD